jgi:hypothetical protein
MAPKTIQDYFEDLENNIGQLARLQPSHEHVNEIVDDNIEQLNDFRYQTTTPDLKRVRDCLGHLYGGKEDSGEEYDSRKICAGEAGVQLACEVLRRVANGPQRSNGELRFVIRKLSEAVSRQW